jgi:hypothetical protein
MIWIIHRSLCQHALFLCLERQSLDWSCHERFSKSNPLHRIKHITNNRSVDELTATWSVEVNLWSLHQCKRTTIKQREWFYCGQEDLMEAFLWPLVCWPHFLEQTSEQFDWSFFSMMAPLINSSVINVTMGWARGLNMCKGFIADIKHPPPGGGGGLVNKGGIKGFCSYSESRDD